MHCHSRHRRLQRLHQGKLGRAHVCLIIFVRSNLPTLLHCELLLNTRLTNLDTRDIPIVLTAYLGWKHFKKTKAVSLDGIPLAGAFDQAEPVRDDPEENQKGWIRTVSWIWD